MKVAAIVAVALLALAQASLAQHSSGLGQLFQMVTNKTQIMETMNAKVQELVKANATSVDEKLTELDILLKDMYASAGPLPTSLQDQKTQPMLDPGPEVIQAIIKKRMEEFFSDN